jgi:hypothetical protein
MGFTGERYSNKRLVNRKGGRYSKTTLEDVGIGGVCECGHLKIHTFDGDPRDPFPSPRMFRYRCFTCEPKTEAETARDAEIARPKQKGIGEWLMEIADGDDRGAVNG